MKHPSDGEIRLGQGMERSRQFLMDNPDLAAVIEEAIRAKFAPAPEVEAETEPEATADPAPAEPAPPKKKGAGAASASK